MKSLFLIVSFIFIHQINGIAQHAELSGNAPQFSDNYLVLKYIENPVTGHSKTIDTLFIDKQGMFKQQIKLSDPTWVFINTGLFRIYLYMSPKKGYEIILPPKTEKTESDIRNPFFKPVIAHIKVLQEYDLADPGIVKTNNDINTRLFRFDTLITSKNNELKYARRNKSYYDTDSLIQSVESLYANDTSSYFQRYRKYRYGILKINSRDTGLKDIYDKYMALKVPEINNPAFMDLFGEMYQEFIFYYSRTEAGKGINYIINRLQDADSLSSRIMMHEAIPGKEFAEMVILKEIHDIYFKDYYYRQALLIILDNIIEKSSYKKNRTIAKGIKKQLTRLKAGNAPPEFNLPDMNEISRSIKDFSGKYVYLNFCTPDNYSCLMEYPFLKTLHNTHNKYLEIVTVMVTEDISEMQDFMKKNDYTWTALFYNNDEELLWNYNIRAFPTNYLISPEGKLIQSPAGLATEGFEKQLFNIMRARGDL